MRQPRARPPPADGPRTPVPQPDPRNPKEQAQGLLAATQDGPPPKDGRATRFLGAPGSRSATFCCPTRRRPGTEAAGQLTDRAVSAPGRLRTRRGGGDPDVQGRCSVCVEQVQHPAKVVVVT